MLQSENGIIMQTWEWESEKAMQVAHEHPAIRAIWGELESLCQFISLKELTESTTRFPSFKILEKS